MNSTGETWRLGHRPALDGLRGVAVLIVVADHAGFLPGSSGSVGVTIFFVLSGFLITRLIVEARAGGRWSAREFYLNRAVRLVPALLLMVGMFSGFLLAAGASASWVLWRALPSVLYVQNFMPRMDSAFFAHTWSLAIEEQFYLVWPLLLPLVMKRRRPMRLLLLASVCSVVFLLTTEVGALPAHAYGLLAGGAFALAVHRVHQVPRLVGVAAGLGILLCVLSFAVISADSLIPRIAAVPFALVLVWRALGDTGPMCSRPLRWVGRISYALYLWHFPLLGLIGPDRGSVDSLGVIVTAVLFATVSTFLVEEPLRRAWRARGQKVRAQRGRPVALRSSRGDQGDRQEQRVRRVVEVQAEAGRV